MRYLSATLPPPNQEPRTGGRQLCASYSVASPHDAALTGAKTYPQENCPCSYAHTNV
ncbi:hypothetical protein ACFOLD_11470 [Kocuria carniphila]|uniref:hypothetical protein n=1 Tax=Kocuria carniphila TaxID=262208 RepID=UPI00361AEA8B